MAHHQSQLESEALLARIEELERKVAGTRRWHSTRRGRIILALGLATTLIIGPALASLAGAAPPQVFWALTGNSGTNPGTNYIGTSDASGLSIRTNGTQAIGIDASQNVSFSKTILGNINGTAVGFTGSLGGDVTGSQSSTVVGALRGINVSTTAPAADQALTYDGSSWTPTYPLHFAYHWTQTSPIYPPYGYYLVEARWDYNNTSSSGEVANCTLLTIPGHPGIIEGTVSMPSNEDGIVWTSGVVHVVPGSDLVTTCSPVIGSDTPTLIDFWMAPVQLQP